MKVTARTLLFPFLLLLCAITVLSACSNGDGNETGTATEKETEKEAVYLNITATEAKTIMDEGGDYVILDVRTEEEFAEGHVPGAILIPHDRINAQASEKLPDKDKLILVYCRSGRRSKLAAEALLALGYKNIKEFGGIIDWPYETEK